jgi:glycosyltransferase involved in cell wall biosynthesis
MNFGEKSKSLNEIKISVVIPTFNRPALAYKAILSALNQTYKPLEVVVVDDGSSEENFSTLSNLIQDLNVKVIRTSGTRSVGQARKIGMKNLDCDFVAFLDDDDYWFSNKLEIQVEYIKKTGAKAVSCLNSGIVTGSNMSDVDIFTLKDLIKNNNILMSGAIVHSEILKEVGFFATSFTVRAIEDWATWLRVATFTNWHRQNQPLVYYENMSHDSLRNFDDFFDQPYRPVFAYLDFLAWSKHQKVNVRYFSLLFRIFRFNLMLYYLIRDKLKKSQNDS